MAHATSLRWSSAWTAVRGAPDEVTLSAGPDRRLALRGVAPSTVAAVIRWESDGVAPSNQDEHRVVDRLVDAGVIATVGAHRIAVLGPPNEAACLAEALEGDHELTASDSADTIVVLRSREGWGEIPDQPHLAVDNRFHHTFVIGPYVIPRYSACTGCLDTRVVRRWPGRDEPPEPAAQRMRAVLAELVRTQLSLISGQQSPLLNATTAWDLERGTVDRQTLLKVPGCRICDGFGTSGRMHLAFAPVEATT